MGLVEKPGPAAAVAARGASAIAARGASADTMSRRRAGQDAAPDLPGSAPHGIGRPRRAAPPRVAIVHEWLDSYGGSERVVEQLLHCFPDADLFAVVDFLPAGERGFLGGRRVRTSFVQQLPFARRLFRRYLGLMPMAVEQFDMSGYDLVISSNHAVAKGVITGPDQVHISYVHSPMRYVWDMQHQYLGGDLGRGVQGLYARWLFGRLREWDVASAHHVDHFIANSTYIARRIRKVYRRAATVIHPPVAIGRFAMARDKDDFYLLACRFVPYKQAAIVVGGFARQPGRRLIVVGSGPEERRVREAARGAGNIRFLGPLPQAELIGLMQRARAFVFAGEEDFGITLVEAQACGTPVIAYGRGGAADIVVPQHAPFPTGVLFGQQAPEAVSAAVERFEALGPRITAEACRANAARFTEERFRAELSTFVTARCAWA